MIGVSFAMTSDAFADGSKTETRRFWKSQHAAKFKPGREFMGWTKDPRAGGMRIHAARVVSCHLECLFELTEEGFQREGGTRYWPTREAYIEAMGDPTDVVSVLRFEHLNARPHAERSDSVQTDVGLPTPDQAHLQTTHPVRRIPYVPNAVRGRPFTIHPTRSKGVTVGAGGDVP